MAGIEWRRIREVHKLPRNKLCTLWNKSFNSEKNSAKSDSIKNNTHLMSRLEFQKDLPFVIGLGR